MNEQSLNKILLIHLGDDITSEGITSLKNALKDLMSQIRIRTDEGTLQGPLRDLPRSLRGEVNSYRGALLKGYRIERTTNHHNWKSILCRYDHCS